MGDDFPHNGLSFIGSCCTVLLASPTATACGLRVSVRYPNPSVSLPMLRSSVSAVSRWTGRHRRPRRLIGLGAQNVAATSNATLGKDRLSNNSNERRGFLSDVASGRVGVTPKTTFVCSSAPSTTSTKARAPAIPPHSRFLNNITAGPDSGAAFPYHQSAEPSRQHRETTATAPSVQKPPALAVNAPAFLAEGRCPPGNSNVAGAPRAGGARVVDRAVLWRFFDHRSKREWRTALREVRHVETMEIATNAGGQGGVTGASERQGRGVGMVGKSWRGLPLMDTVYNLVMDTLAISARWQEAFELTEEMKHRGVCVDLVKYNSVLKACSVAKEWEVALRLLVEMHDPRSPLPTPDVISFNTTLAACARGGRVAEALSLLDEMWRPRPYRASSVNTATLQLTLPVKEATGGTVDGATQPSAAVADAGSSVKSPWLSFANLSPAPTPTLRSFNTALSACVRGGTESGEDGGREGGSTALEGAERAISLLESMRRVDDGAPSPDVKSFKEVVIACGRAGQWQQALSMVDIAIEDGLKPTVELFVAAITACGQSGQWVRALTLLRVEMPKHGVAPDKRCFNAVIRACANAGEVYEALRVLDVDMRHAGSTAVRSKPFRNDGGGGGDSRGEGKRVYPCAFSYSPILDALARQGDRHLAMGLLQEIESTTRYAPNKRHYSAVFSAFQNYGDADGARGVLAEWQQRAAALTAAATASSQHNRQRQSNDTSRTRGGGQHYPRGSSYDVDDHFQNDIHVHARAQAEAPSNEPGMQPLRQYTGVQTGRDLEERRERDFVGSSSVVDSSSSAPEQTVPISGPHRTSPYHPSQHNTKGPAGVIASLARERAEEGDWLRCLELLQDAKDTLVSIDMAKTARCGEKGKLTTCANISDDDLDDASGCGKVWEVLGAPEEENRQPWWKIEAGKRETHDRAAECVGALRDCYEASIEALGHCGRWPQALEVLKEASVWVSETGVGNEKDEGWGALDIDPSCFLPALRASVSTSNCRSSDPGLATRDTGNVDSLLLLPGFDQPPVPRNAVMGEGESGRGGASVRCGDMESGFEQGISLLHAMEKDVGVVPDAHCVNTVMEACVTAGAWEQASRLFDDMEDRFAMRLRRHRRKLHSGASGSIVVTTSGAGAGARRATATPKRVIRTTDYQMEPTVFSYHLALQACAMEAVSSVPIRQSHEDVETTSATNATVIERSLARCTFEHSNSERSTKPYAAPSAEPSAERAPKRAVLLVQKMKAAGLAVGRDTVTFAHEACLKAGMWGLATELAQLLADAESVALLKGGRWRRRGIIAAAEAAARGRRSKSPVEDGASYYC